MLKRIRRQDCDSNKNINILIYLNLIKYLFVCEMKLLYTRAVESRALLTFATAKSKHALLLIRICYKS